MKFVEEESGRRKIRISKRGPFFHSILLADENSTEPKGPTNRPNPAMARTMPGSTVTAAGTRFELSQPFFVLATQNPIEQRGTYPPAEGANGPVFCSNRRRLFFA